MTEDTLIPVPEAGDLPLVSLVVPVLNEAANIPRLIPALQKIAAGLEGQYRFEYVFTDNCSTDETFELLANEAAKDKRIRVFRFSRNFGFQRSILTGLLSAQGDAAIQLDADLQDPPELIPEMLAAWQKGYDVVYGIRRRRKENVFINGCRRFFYWFVDKISDHPLPRDAGDFRLISRRVMDILTNIKGSVPYIRGTISEIGFPQIGIPYDRSERLAGESKFRFLSLVRFAIDAMLHQSTLPLRLAGFIAIFISIISMLLLVYFGWRYIQVGQSWPSGFASLAFLILVSMIMNAFLMAIIGAYISMIYNAQKGFPISIIDQKIDH